MMREGAPLYMWLVARCASRRARAMSESSACAASSNACAEMD